MHASKVSFSNEYVGDLRNGRERFATDERILGCGTFVERLPVGLGRSPARLAEIRHRCHETYRRHFARRAVVAA